MAAQSQDGGLATFSAYGRSVLLSAPGQDVLSTAKGGAYSTSSGTSIATAQVSGAAALLAAARPTATPDQIRDALVGGVRHMSVDAQMVGSGGSLDASRAMTRLIPGAGPRVTLASRKLIRSKTGKVALKWRASGAVGAVAQYRVKVGRRTVRRALLQRGQDGLPQRRTMRLKAGRYRFTVAAYDASGRPLATRAGKVKVAKKKHRRAAKPRLIRRVPFGAWPTSHRPGCSRLARELPRHARARLRADRREGEAPRHGRADRARRPDRVLRDRRQGLRRHRAVTSEMFEDRAKVWPGKPGKADPYPWRFTTEPLQILDEDEFVPAVEVVDRLEHAAKWPAEHWTLAFQGQLRTVSEADAALLEQRIAQAAGQPSAA